MININKLYYIINIYYLKTNIKNIKNKKSNLKS
jgi:hypothetical protein